MGDLGNWGDLNDYKNAKESWLASAGKSQKNVRVYVFKGYQTIGNEPVPDETFRKVFYSIRRDIVWLSNVKVYDTIKGGYFTTGDLDVYSEFPIKGFSAGYKLTNGNVVPEYAGDLIEWNGKLWEVSDQLEPVTWGVSAIQVFFRSVLRRTQRTGIGTEVGA